MIPPIEDNNEIVISSDGKIGLRHVIGATRKRRNRVIQEAIAKIEAKAFEDLSKLPDVI